MTKSFSGSLTAGLQILYLHSALPALLTDALMKDKTELSGEHGRTRTPAHTHFAGTAGRLGGSGKVTL